MEAIISVGRYIGLLFVSGYISTFTPQSFITWYAEKFPEPSGFGPDLSSLPVYFAVTVGIFSFMTVLFGRDIFRFKQVYAILSITLAVSLITDPMYFYVYTCIIVGGAMLGLLSRLGAERTLGNLLRLQPYKKYF